jgi:hypothetical protein
VRRQSLRPNLRQQPPQSYSALAQQSDDNSGDESSFEIRKLFTASWHCILFALLSAVFPFETALRKALFQKAGKQARACLLPHHFGDGVCGLGSFAVVAPIAIMLPSAGHNWQFYSLAWFSETCKHAR